MNKHLTVYFIAIILGLMGQIFPIAVMAEPSLDEQKQPIADKINAVDTALEQLSSNFNKIKPLSKAKDLANRLPINKDNIENAIKNLSKQTITQEDINANKQLINEIEQTIESQHVQLEILDKSINKLGQTIEEVTALQQLLSNPINRDSISNQLKEKVPLIFDKAKSLDISYKQQQNNYAEYNEQLKANLALLERWHAAINDQLIVQENTQKGTSDEAAPHYLSSLQKNYESQLAGLQRQLTNQRQRDARLEDIEKLQEAIYHNKTMAWLIGVDMQIIEAISYKEKLPAISAAEDSDDVAHLELQITSINHTLTELQNLRGEVEEQFTYFNKRVDITGANPTLDDAFTQRLKNIAYQQLQLEQRPAELTAIINEKKQKSLLTRDKLYDKAHFLTGVTGLKKSLLLIAFQIKISFQTLIKHIVEKPSQTITIAGIFLAAIALLFKGIGHWASRRSRRRMDNFGIISSVRKFSHVIRKYRYVMALLLLVIILVQVTNIADPSSAIINVLTYSILGLIAWLELTAIEVKLDNLPKKNARYSNIVTFVITTIAVIYALASISSVQPNVVSIYEKLLMISIIAFTIIIHRNLEIYLKNEETHINSRAYRIYLWCINLLAKIIVAVCLLSLIGYSKLAWLILSYVGTITLYGIVSIIGFILINQTRKIAKLWCIKRFKHGAFIAQDIVSPVSSILKVLWFLITTAVLFSVLQWDSNSYLISKTLSVLRHPIISFGNNQISLMSILLLALSIYLIFRVAKWLRTFSYHWLYAGINDLGIRNSLSIFSQYVAALAGVLIALNVIGIDLTSLAVFAGALGVGIGLGLQDIAKNFISGILLLIERPLRNGDWVTIDGSEGTIKSIGMRAITMETFDKQEVIIPNGNAMNNSFTNWTHSNTITRTVLYIGAGYDSEPEKVLGILNDIITDTNVILADPAPLILMWEYADSCINYRVQYFIDVRQTGVLTTKNSVLKAIWYAFKENDIEIPFPQQDIHFKNMLELGNPDK